MPTAVGGPLKHPYGLTVARNGDLYIVDVGRDQVLRRLPSGKFHVVAGDGRRGFSGDGGLATAAELNLSVSSGIVIANDGTLYIADSGNDRVRAVSPDGTIRTVAGDGRPVATTAWSFARRRHSRRPSARLPALPSDRTATSTSPRATWFASRRTA